MTAVQRVGHYALRAWRHVRFFVIFLVILGAVRSAVADWNDVPTGSMKPTIVEGDRIFVNKLAYDLKLPFTTYRLVEWGQPQRGDVVVFYAPDDGVRLVKRVVAVGGDTVQLINDKLIINGVSASYTALSGRETTAIDAADRPHYRFADEQAAGPVHAVMATPGVMAMRSFGPITVPPGSYFMMGDNRDNSRDSRYFGPVSRDRILGRAVGVALSLDIQHSYAPRWGRFFMGLR